MVTLLVAFIVVLLLYTRVWSPLHDWSNRADAKYQRQLAVLDWMRVHESEARAAGQRVERLARSRLVADAGCKLCGACRACSCCDIRPEGDGVSVVLRINRSIR